MTSSSDSDGPSTRRSRSGWLWCGAVVLVAPPLVTLAVFLTGFAVNRIQTDYAQLRFLVTLLLCGPLAPGAGVASAVGLSYTFFGASRLDRVLAVAVIVVNLGTVFYVWAQAFHRFVGVGWG